MTKIKIPVFSEESKYAVSELEEEILEQLESDETEEGEIEEPEEEVPGLISLYGDLSSDNESVEDIVRTLTAIRIGIESDPEMAAKKRTMNFLVSSLGGDAQEMFAIYDAMRLLRDNMELRTLGLGKVMSAATLILAAGTPGSRFVGQNCRIMLHGARGMLPGHESLAVLDSELKELKWYQQRYIECLSQNTKLSVPQLKKMFRSEKNYYLSAEQAVEYGLADSIL